MDVDAVATNSKRDSVTIFRMVQKSYLYLTTFSPKMLATLRGILRRGMG